MPIYEYRCQECGGKFEKLVRRPGNGDITCPSCGNAEVTQELSTFAAHSGGKQPTNLPMCPSGGTCPTPGACGLN
ncbi:MAG: zinc ribbon domain-containing protein [Bryobacteraceae bacterium]|nr:zinc ribbon domain-containing protein [Bryobacterales bacterium]MEB2360015.1 zinc ribbon domain-containing protein [Bryobacterales bacterium]NUN01386.1 zinc ribbon domain-containing protein [Bryobacteraceae bacterium]